MSRLITLFVILLLVTGCATQSPGPDVTRQVDDWQRQKPRLEALQSWSLAGKVGLRTPDDTTGANLDWTQRPGHYRMLLSGPFGTGRSVLEGRPGQVSLTTGNGEFHADSPEALMHEQLGWSLPISALDYWIRGLPTPDMPHELVTDELGFPTRLHQAGWNIEYSAWTDAGGLWLPQRLFMTYDDLHATLVINDWNLASREAEETR
ncbi:lipoprotein insertase outer membrane protein LolB [Halomonas shantousis]